MPYASFRETECLPPLIRIYRLEVEVTLASGDAVVVGLELRIGHRLPLRHLRQLLVDEGLADGRRLGRGEVVEPLLPQRIAVSKLGLRAWRSI